jgi:hypothetical protein
MLAIAALGLVVNLAGMLLLRPGSSESLNVKGAYFEVLSDALSSLGVILAAALIWTTGWYYADPLISAGIGLFILPRTWRLLKEATSVLLEGTPTDVSLAAVRAAIESLPGVVGVHDLHAWSLTSGVNALSAHVVIVEGARLGETLTVVHREVTSTFSRDGRSWRHIFEPVTSLSDHPCGFRSELRTAFDCGEPDGQREVASDSADQLVRNPTPNTKSPKNRSVHRGTCRPERSTSATNSPPLKRSSVGWSRNRR